MNPGRFKIEAAEVVATHRTIGVLSKEGRPA